MKAQIMISLKILLVLTILTGIIYPLMITGIAQVIFPFKANGSMVKRDGKIIGSALIGQKNDSAAYFWPRPSAIDYNPLPSSGSNDGPTSKKLKKLVAERRTNFVSANAVKDSANIPAEMLFASASGLDPHISPRAALLQVGRVAKTRNFNAAKTKQLLGLVQASSEKLQYGLLGEERVNVLLLNIALDQMAK